MTVFDDLVAAANPTILTRNIHRQQGASWEIRQGLQVNGTAMDWTGCTATCEIRDTVSNALIYAFTSLTLTSGLLTMTATPTATAALAPGTYSYDVDIVNASSRRLAFMSGWFKIGKQVTA